ncbi:phage late control D family protein [Paracraurococcus ruber]|uniref:Phage protein D n=1 Tax=Paracraurococcus ruber TaxID=77675 RepID=A0ABS1CRW9_9PROT|nr:contractile injection system protein, VgrG/Pvc8 family [Paracraurococcus ruber]MBK1657108.1 hypothetical protein [Paracraurococcus ruber]TDG33406.1 hypothetical protein E2C05_04060 [Paracraurococcus ruber]
MPPLALANIRPTARIDGQDRPALEQAVLELTIAQPAAGMDSAEMRLVNFSPTATDPPDFPFADIPLGARIEIFVGEPGAPALFDGEVTGLEERYGGAAPELVVLAEDRLHRLARKRRSRVFESQSADAVVGAMAAEAGLQADARVSSAAATWHQMNESDLAFLRRLLARFGVTPRLRQGRLVARQEEAPLTTIPLSVNAEIRKLRILADLARQASQATVRGWDLKADAVVTARADRATPPAQRTGAKDLLSRLGWPGDDLLVSPPPATQGLADDQAAAAFSGTARRFLSGDMICDGNPAVIAGAAVEIAGVSSRLAGIYRVTEATHHFDLGHGYETFARLARADWP